MQQFEQPWPASIGDDGKPLQRPRVVIASRPPRRRGILNELDLIQHLTSKWDVNVTVTNFRMGLAGAIALMQETDVLLGMHGAGTLCIYTLDTGFHGAHDSALCWAAAMQDGFTKQPTLSKSAYMSLLNTPSADSSSSIVLAGLTNAFWLKKGAVMLQLLPYAWEVYPGQLIRSCLSADIPSAFQGHYLQVGCMRVQLAVPAMRIMATLACMHIV